MAKNPKVSVLTISYNQEKYIRQTLEGFVMQKTDFEVEVIAADDCSSDDTPQIIKEYADRYPRLIKPILRTKNIGSVPNLLDVFRAAKGDYIALCEGDDYWTDPNKLQIQVDFLNTHPKAGGCFHRAQVIFEDTDNKPYTYPGVEDKSWYTTAELLKINYIPTNSVMYRRRDYSAMPNDVMPYDWYLHLYHAQYGKLELIDEVMSVYRKHQGGLWWEYDQNRDEIWKKYGVAYLALYHEVMNLYAKKPVYEAIIRESINNLMDTLVGVDERHGTQLFKAVVKKYPELVDPFIFAEHDKLIQKTEVANRLTEELLAVGEERNELLRQLDASRQETDTVSQELETIRSSRTWQLKLKADRARHKFKRTNRST